VNAMLLFILVSSSLPVFGLCKEAVLERKNDPLDRSWVCPRIGTCTPYGHGDPLGAGGDFGCSADGKDVMPRVVLREARLHFVVPHGEGIVVKTWPSARIRAIEVRRNMRKVGLWFFFPDEAKYTHFEVASYDDNELVEVRSYDRVNGDLFGSPGRDPRGKCVVAFADAAGKPIRTLPCDDFE
jgi:hypothetical protein